MLNSYGDLSLDSEAGTTSLARTAFQSRYGNQRSDRLFWPTWDEWRTAEVDPELPYARLESCDSLPEFRRKS